MYSFVGLVEPPVTTRGWTSRPRVGLGEVEPLGVVRRPPRPVTESEGPGSSPAGERGEVAQPRRPVGRGRVMDEGEALVLPSG